MDCIHLNSIKVKVKRPLAIQVMYLNEEGKRVERELYDFEARLFHHEIQHLEGIPFINWKVSEGEIDIKDEYISQFDNLNYTIEYYKNRLRDTRKTQPNFFEEFDINLINAADNVTSPEYLEEKVMMDYEFRNKKKVSFEDVMLIDIEKAIKRDLKLKLKTENKI